VGKGQAVRAWGKAAKLADPDKIIAAAAAYARQRQGEDPKYTKYPATWLNGQCWDDEAPAAPGRADDIYDRLA